MRESFEISDRYIEPGDANDLLYEPLEGGATFRTTTRYEVEFEGDRGSLETFVRTVLLDPVSQDLHEGDEPALEDFIFVLEYGMKSGALDLEKEAVLSYYWGIEEPAFELEDLVIRRRIYLFGGKSDDSKRFIRDVCNAAIHNWTVIEAG